MRRLVYVTCVYTCLRVVRTYTCNWQTLTNLRPDAGRTTKEATRPFSRSLCVIRWKFMGRERANKRIHARDFRVADIRMAIGNVPGVWGRQLKVGRLMLREM